MNNDNRLDKIRKSIKVGDIVNGCNGYISTWYIIKDIKKLDTPIEDRANVNLTIRLKSIDKNMCNTNKMFFIADILQFAIIQHDN